MRPTRMELQNFGPYPRGEVRFNEIEDIFLIAGETGAGKTALLDGLMYALFETSSGGTRPWQSLRYSSAPRDEPCRVRLEFEHDKNQYVLERGFAPKKRSEGIDKFVSLKNLTNGDQAGTIKTVKDMLDKVLHSTPEEWNMKTVIAQGKFDKLINADTDDQVAVIKSIFHTEKYKKYVDRVQALYNEAREDTALAARDIRSAVTDSLISEEGSELSAKRAEYSEFDKPEIALGMINEILLALENQNNADKDIIDTAEDSKNRLKKAYDDAFNAFSSAKALRDMYDNLRTLKEEEDKLDLKKAEIAKLRKSNESGWSALNTVHPKEDALNAAKTEREKTLGKIGESELRIPGLESAVAQSRSNLEAAEAAREAVKSDRDSIPVIEKTIPEYDRLEALREKKTACEGEVSKTMIALEEAIGIGNALNESLEGCVAKLKDREGADTELVIADQKVSVAKDRLRELKSLAGKAKDYDTAVIRVKQKAEAYETAMREYAEASEHCSEVEKHYFGSYLHNLASTLEDGCRCPLCGGTFRKGMTEVPEHIASEAEWAKAKEFRDTKDGLMKAAQNDNTQAVTSADTLAGSLREMSAKLGIDLDFSEPAAPQVAAHVKIQESQIGDLSIARDAAHTRKQEYGALVKERDDLAAKIKASGDDRISKEKAYNDATIASATATSEFDSVKSTLEHPTRDAAMIILENLREKVKAADDAAISAQNILKTDEEKLNAEKVRISELKKALVDNNKAVEMAESAFDKCIADEGFASIDDYHASLREEPILKAEQKTCNDYDKNVEVNQALIRKTLKDIDNRPMPEDVGSLEIAKNQAEAAYSNAVSSVGKITERHRKNSESYGKICERFSEYTVLSEKSQMLEELDAVGRGVRLDIDYDGYVQSRFLNTILQAANERFVAMTDGQYRLCTRVDAAMGGDGSLLDLFVLNSKDSTYRVVKSLSGGETFMAALCLALGLADTVDSYSGGNSVDCLFIDEGFGTLDKGYLNKAVSILANIADGKGASKCIGIISHREELREVIPKRIDIIKEDKCSRIEPHY